MEHYPPMVVVKHDEHNQIRRVIMSNGGRMTQHVAFKSNGAFGNNQTSFVAIASRNARSHKKFKKAHKQ